MSRTFALLGSFVVMTAIGACAPVAPISMGGSYAMTIVVTETNTPGVMVGEVDGFLVTVTTAGDSVEATAAGVFGVTGTRSGNSVLLEGSGGGTAVWTLDLMWTSETDFRGEGAFVDGVEYVEFDVRGFSIASSIVIDVGTDSAIHLRQSS